MDTRRQTTEHRETQRKIPKKIRKSLGNRFFLSVDSVGSVLDFFLVNRRGITDRHLAHVQLEQARQSSRCLQAVIEVPTLANRFRRTLFRVARHLFPRYLFVRLQRDVEQRLTLVVIVVRINNARERVRLCHRGIEDLATPADEPTAKVLEPVIRAPAIDEISCAPKRPGVGGFQLLVEQCVERLNLIWWKFSQRRAYGLGDVLRVAVRVPVGTLMMLQNAESFI